MGINNSLVLFGLAAAVSVAGQTGVAYGHGCQAQGGCCTVGSACIDITANSPVYMMFAVVSVGAVAMFGFYNRPEQRKRLGMIFNIFY